MPRPYNEPLEYNIEVNIAFFLENQGVAIKKINSEWFYNAKKGIYQKRKNQYSRPGISDLCGTITPFGRALWIEVKRPEEMAFFDRPAHIIEQDYLEAKYHKKLSKSSIEKYEHALEQARFIENEIKHGAVAFYASSVEEVIKKLKDFGISVS